MQANAERYFYTIENVGGGVANEKNLIPIAERSPNEAREMGRKGGQKSGETRRRKKSMRDAMNLMLSQPVVNNEIYNQTALMGVAPENIDNQNAIVAAMIKEAAMGNVKAFSAICDLIGENGNGKRVEIAREELKLKKAAEARRNGETEEIADDGFIAALNGTAAEDWEEDEDS